MICSSFFAASCQLLDSEPAKPHTYDSCPDVADSISSTHTHNAETQLSMRRLVAGAQRQVMRRHCDRSSEGPGVDSAYRDQVV